MTNLDKEELATRMKALDKEERELVLKMFPTSDLINELDRRLNELERIVYEIKSTLRSIK